MMTETLQPDPLCPHGRAVDQACDDCLAEIVDPWRNPWGVDLTPPVEDE